MEKPDKNFDVVVRVGSSQSRTSAGLTWEQAELTQALLSRQYTVEQTDAAWLALGIDLRPDQIERQEQVRAEGVAALQDATRDFERRLAAVQQDRDDLLVRATTAEHDLAALREATRGPVRVADVEAEPTDG